MQTTKIHNIIALDVGEKRVGVAKTNTLARLPSPYVTLERGQDFWTKLSKLITDESIDEIVVGLPRNLNGDDTAQTALAREFAKDINDRFGLPVHLQDEALTSQKAETELKARGKAYAKGDIDSLAATYILEDYLNSRGS